MLNEFMKNELIKYIWNLYSNLDNTSKFWKIKLSALFNIFYSNFTIQKPLNE